MRIAVHSDLHTEITPCRLQGLAWAELLILAGDIGNLESLPIFFAQLRKDAPNLPVLYILGNHDRYGMARRDGVAAHRRIAAQYGVRLLDNEAVVFQDVLFLGSTLWTNFALADEPAVSMQWAGATLPDFQEIQQDDGSLLTPTTMLQWFEQSYAFLDRALNVKNVREKVVISHFLPSRVVVSPEHGTNQEALIRSAYWASDVPELYQRANFWIYGHSHSNINLSQGHTSFISNQRGGKRKVADYQNEYLLIV